MADRVNTSFRVKIHVSDNVEITGTISVELENSQGRGLTKEEYRTILHATGIGADTPHIIIKSKSYYMCTFLAQHLSKVAIRFQESRRLTPNMTGDGEHAIVLIFRRW